MRQLYPFPMDEVDLERRYDDMARWADRDMPYVLLNMVASTDGAFAVDGRTAPLSSEADRALFHLLRSLVDVVLVGAQTVRIEGYGPPRLSDEWRAQREARSQEPAPRLAIVSRHLDLDPEHRVFRGARPLLLAPSDADPLAVERLAPVADIIRAGRGSVDLRAALAEMRRRGIRTVLCEGGPTLNGELARAGAIHELCLTVAPQLAGGGGGSGLLGRVRMATPMNLSLIHVLEDAGHLFLRYRTTQPWPVPAADDSALSGGSAEDFHSVVGALDYPMMIVTAAAGQGRGGCLVGFGAQCSISPPRFMVWISKRNHTYRVAQEANVLIVHFPSSADRDLAELFGTTTGHDVDKFERCRWRPGPGGAPVLEQLGRWFAGSITERLDSGDHVAYMLDPISASSGDWAGQLGFQALRDLDPGQPA